jgi:uncharacterized protein
MARNREISPRQIRFCTDPGSYPAIHQGKSDFQASHTRLALPVIRPDGPGRILALSSVPSILPSPIRCASRPIMIELRDSMHLSFFNIVLLVISGILAGVMNAVAGGGTFLTFPALVLTGVPTIAANQTSAIAVFPGQIASTWAYRKILAADLRTVLVLGLTSLAGGMGGAIVLLNTPSPAFDRLVPWLLLFATLLFAFGNVIRKRLGWHLVHPSHGEIGWTPLLKAASLQLVIGFYGGFYGAGAGILELAVLDMLGFDDINLANALKVILNAAFSPLAVIIFIIAGKIFWPEGLIVAAAAIIGGYGGAWVAQRLPQSFLRGFVIFVGAVMTVYFFSR